MYFTPDMVGIKDSKGSVLYLLTVLGASGIAGECLGHAEKCTEMVLHVHITLHFSMTN